MKIAMLIADGPDASTGGGARASIQLARALDSLDGVSVDVFKTVSANDGTLEAEYGVDLRPMQPRSGVKRFLDRFSPVSKKYNTPLIGSRIPPDLRTGDYDVVNLNNSVLMRSFYTFVRWAATIDAKSVITGHGIHELFNQSDLLDMGLRDRALYRCSILPLYKHCLRSVDGVIALSEDARSTVRAELPDVRNLFVSSNGVAADVQVAEPDRDLLSKYDLSSPLVLYVGGLQQTKGIDDVVELSHRLDEGTVAVVGGDTDGIRDRVEREVNDDVARILGYVPTEDLHHLYALADVLFYPTRSDNFPLAVLEAMINATPVVATDVGAIRHEVGPGGIVVDDPAEIFDALDTVLTDRDAAAMGTAARERVETEFTWEAVARHHVSIYESLLDRDTEAARRPVATSSADGS